MASADFNDWVARRARRAQHISEGQGGTDSSDVDTDALISSLGGPLEANEMPESYSKEVIDAKLDTLRQEIRADFAEIKTEVAREVGAIRTDIAEFKGTVKGIGIAISIGIPVVTTILVFALNRLFPTH